MFQMRKFSALVKQLQQLRKLSATSIRREKGNLSKVDPYSKITIKCNYDLKIVPYDLLDCPDSNLLKITVSNAGREPKVKISGTDVSIVDSGDVPVPCLLQIPIKADLVVENHGDSAISELYSDTVRIQSRGNIKTKNIRSSLIDLHSETGDVSCLGTTLGQTVKVLTGDKGKILLEKLQGDKFEAESNLGSITVNCSYSNTSFFKTSQGDLLLKNIHKYCHVRTEGKGKLIMNGFYGTLQAEVGSEEVSLQLSEIHGQSKVVAKNANDLCLAVSENVIENAEIAVNSELVEIEPELDGIQIASELERLRLGNESSENKLEIFSGKLVRVKKMSWMDTFGFAVKSD